MQEKWRELYLTTKSNLIDLPKVRVKELGTSRVLLGLKEADMYIKDLILKVPGFFNFDSLWKQLGDGI